MGEECIHLQATRLFILHTERTEECYMIRGRRRGKHRVTFETGNHPGKRGKLSNQEKLRGHKKRKGPIRNGMNRQTASSINKPIDKETYWNRFSYFGKESRFLFPPFWRPVLRGSPFGDPYPRRSLYMLAINFLTLA